MSYRADSAPAGRQQSARLQHTAKIMMQQTQQRSTQQAKRQQLVAHVQQPLSQTQPIPSNQPIPIDLKQSVFMSAGELNHYYRLASLDDSAVSDSAARRAATRERSQARYSQWSNTLEAQRQRKKAERLRNLEQQELEQQRVDAEEAAYQEAQRRVVLDRANRLLWQETDRVKSFHGGLLLASVLKEREAQLELQAAKRAQKERIEQAFHEQAEADRLRALEMAEQEQAKRQAQSRAAALQQLEQLHEVRLRQAAERAEEVQEGARIKRVAQQAIVEASEEERRRQEKMAQYNAEYVRANDEQLALKAARAEVEAKEDAKIAAFAAEKERLTNLRRQHEAAKFAAKQARFESMLRRQYDHLLQLRDEEARRTEKQMREIEERTENRFAAEAARAEQLKEDTRASRQAQLERKAAEAARQRHIDSVLTAEWKQRNLEMEEAEWEEQRRIREANVRTKAALKEQMRAREERSRAEVEAGLEEAKMLSEARAREDAVFEAYAAQQLADLQIKGKSTIPLQMTLHQERMRSVRPGNFPAPKFR